MVYIITTHCLTISRRRCWFSSGHSLVLSKYLHISPMYTAAYIRINVCMGWKFKNIRSLVISRFFQYMMLNNMVLKWISWNHTCSVYIQAHENVLIELTVTWYLTQSAQKFFALNFLRIAMEIPCFIVPAKAIIPPTEWYRGKVQ